jgi:hypothetical protein
VTIILQIKLRLPLDSFMREDLLEILGSVKHGITSVRFYLRVTTFFPRGEGRELSLSFHGAPSFGRLILIKFTSGFPGKSSPHRCAAKRHFYDFTFPPFCN